LLLSAVLCPSAVAPLVLDAPRPLLSIGVSYLHGDQQQTRMIGQTDGQTDSFIDHRCKNVQIKIKKVKTRKKRDKNKKRL